MSSRASLPFLGYVRVSKVGDRSGPGFISPDVQRDTIERLALANGLELAELVEELDVSGGKSAEERRLEELVRRIEEGEAGGLLVWKVSRFSRSLADGVLTADRIAKAGGRIIGSDLDTEAPMGKALLGFLLGWAEEELDARRAGWREAQVRAAARGAYPSRTPLGYTKDEDGRLVVDPATADVVRRVFRMRAYEGASLGACGEVIGAPRSSATALLSNRAYLGLIDHGQGDGAIYVENAHEALVDERTWHLAQRKGAATTRTGSVTGKGVLLGLILCAGCGKPMTQAASGPPEARVVSYVCRKRRSGFVCPEPAGARVDAVDALVWPGVAERTPERTDWSVMVDAEELGARHQEAVDELDAFLETALVGALGPELYAREVSRRREEIAARWAAFEEAERQGRALLRLGETSGIEHDRARARQVIESVTLAKSTRGRWQPIEERITIVWKEQA